jgi:collagenase-like PrtC family protease
MKLFMPTNFTYELADSLKEYSHDITFYGQSARDVLGGGRPSLFLPDPSREEIIKYIAYVKKLGYQFSYLVNSSCTGGIEMTKEGNEKLRELFNWIGESGADEITVAIPYLAKMCMDIAPNLKVNAGLYARITDVTTAIRWSDLGVNKLTLFLNLNRDFDKIKKIKEVTGKKIELIATLSCINGCIASPFCSSLIAHASMNKGEGSVVHTVFNCYREKLKNPTEIIKSCWIRPEDLHIYEEYGVDVIKITERYDDTKTLVMKAKAYLNKSFEGNFFDLLSLHPRKPLSIHKEKIKRYIDKKGILNQKKINDYFDSLAFLSLDNRELDGFIDFFLEKKCDLENCATCSYCEKFAKKIKKSGDKSTIKSLDKFIKDIKDGSFFEK